MARCRLGGTVWSIIPPNKLNRLLICPLALRVLFKYTVTAFLLSQSERVNLPMPKVIYVSIRKRRFVQNEARKSKRI